MSVCHYVTGYARRAMYRPRRLSKLVVIDSRSNIGKLLLITIDSLELRITLQSLPTIMNVYSGQSTFSNVALENLKHGRGNACIVFFNHFASAIAIIQWIF